MRSGARFPSSRALRLEVLEDRRMLDAHGDDSSTATSVTVPSTTSGEIVTASDLDFFSFSATSGTIYAISMFVDDRMSHNVEVSVLDTDGITRLGGLLTSLADKTGFVAPANGTYYLGIRNARFSEAAYSLTITEDVDNHSNDSASATAITVPSTTEAEIQYRGDVDFFGFDAMEGGIYNVSLTTDTRTALAIYHTDGSTEILQSDAGAIGFLAPADGQYFVRAASADNRYAEGYTFNIAEEFDEHSNDAVAATPISVPSMMTGRIEYPGDVDFFALNATGGSVYNFVATGWIDVPVIRYAMYAPDGTTRLFSDRGISTGRFGFFAPADGTYFLAIAQDGRIGAPRPDEFNYSFDVVEILDDHGRDADSATPVASDSTTSGDLQFRGDSDFFAFDAVAGSNYGVFITHFTNSPFPVRERLRAGAGDVKIYDNDGTYVRDVAFAPEADGTYFIEVTQFQGFEALGKYVLNLVVDDHGNKLSSSTPIVGPQGMAVGEIEFPFDTDVFSFEAVAGVAYRVVLTIDDETDLTDVSIFSPSQRRLWLESQTGSGFEQIEFMALENGRYYVEVVEKNLSSFQRQTYRVSVDFQNDDDHGNEATTASSIVAPSTTAGDINFNGDTDFFAFEATVGTPYNVYVTRDTLPGWIPLIYDTDGITILTGSGVFVAPDTGTYFISVNKHGNRELGAYTLNIAADHGNDAATATLIAVPSMINGEIPFVGDVDFFAFNASAGTSYEIFTSLEDGSGDLGLSQLSLFWIDGRSVITSAFLGGPGRGARIDFTAPIDGIFFVEVVGFVADSGTYTLDIAIDGLGCDYVSEAGCGIADLDALYAGSNGVPTPLTDEAIAQWLIQASASSNPLKSSASIEYVYGDTNLDGNVNSEDLGMLLNNFGDMSNLNWGSGNLNSDMSIDSTDLGLLLNNFGFESEKALASVAAAMPIRGISPNTSLADNVFTQFDSDTDEDETEDSFLIWQ